MILSLFLTSFVALIVATVLLLVFGSHLRRTSRILGILLTSVMAVASGEIAARLWNLEPRPVLIAEASLLVFGIVVAFARPVWNPIGQTFYASFLAAALSYLGFAA